MLTNLEQFLSTEAVNCIGQEKTGKSALARYTYLSLVAEDRAALLLDIDQPLNHASNERILSRAYQEQFQGDYSLWIKQNCKTLVIDNFSVNRYSLDFIDFAKDIFENIIITLDSDTFFTFLIDEPRLAEFRQLQIEQLTRHQQQKLIRKRLSLSESARYIHE